MGMVIYTRLVVDLAMEYATRLGKRTVTQLWHSSGFTSSSVAGLKSQSLNLVLLSSVEQRQQVLMSWITILMQKYYRNGWIENRTPMRTSKSRQTLSQAGNTGQARNIYLIWRKPMWPSGNMISKSCSGFPSLSDCPFSCRNVPGTAESESRFTQDSHNISRKILWVFHEFFIFFPDSVRYLLVRIGNHPLWRSFPRGRCSNWWCSGCYVLITLSEMTWLIIIIHIISDNVE